MTDQTMTMTPERVMDELDALLTRAKELALHITEGAARAALSRPAVPETLAKWASNPEEDDGIGWKQGYEAARRWVAMQLSWRSDLTSVVNASSATEPAEQHPDDAAVDRFAQAMKAKLAQARAKGRSGWDDPAQCSPEYLADLLAGHVRKGNDGNFVDVANFAMMLHQRGAAPSVMPDAIRRSAAEESLTTEQPEGESVATVKAERDALREQLRQLEQRDFQELARANERIDALMNEVRTLRDDRRAAGERVRELVDALELARGEIAHYFKEIRHLGGSWEVKRALDRVDQVLDAYPRHGDAAMQEGE